MRHLFNQEDIGSALKAQFRIELFQIGHGGNFHRERGILLRQLPAGFSDQGRADALMAAVFPDRKAAEGVGILHILPAAGRKQPDIAEQMILLIQGTQVQGLLITEVKVMINQTLPQDEDRKAVGQDFIQRLIIKLGKGSTVELHRTQPL